MPLNLLKVTLALVIVAGVAVSLRPADKASAIVHLAEIHEIMVGFDGDPDVQWVEINMLLGGQNITQNAAIATFDSSGAFIDANPGMMGNQPLLVMGSNVLSGAQRRWIAGTTEFETASGITADFTFSASPGLPVNVGMVCLFEQFKDFTNPNRSVDCVAYGGASFTGNNPNSSPSESATTGPGDGTMSLTRINTAGGFGGQPWAQSDDANDFALRCPSPENNDFELGTLGDDTDLDGLTDCREGELGKNPNVADTDGDGCSDGQEEGTNPIMGGDRDSLNEWDYYDVIGPMAGPPDGVIDLANDILGVILHFSPDGSPPYDVQYDRGVGGPGGSWVNTQPPDGVVDLPNDILGVILQFQHNCA